MKIGFLMGSFDPIHIGHINMIRESLSVVDKVIVVPSGHNPWKKSEPSPFDLRVKMISEAIVPFGDNVEVSTIEGKFEPPYYANKPLNYFRGKYDGNELFIICGSDIVEKIPFWKNAKEDIMPFYKVICLERVFSDKDTEKRAIFVDDECSTETYEYQHIGIVSFPVSSTLIRELTKENKVLYPLVPQCVERIIKENKLYV
jgi:nicotinate-nucleotide adenylyltransferase